MHHENGAFDVAGGFAHIDAPADPQQPNRHLGGRRRALLIAPRAHVLNAAAGLEMVGPDLEEGVVLQSPSEAREVEKHARLFHLFWLVAAPQAAARVGPVENETIDPLGMPRRVFDRDRSAPAGRHQRKSPEARGIDHLLEILDPGFERQVIDAAVGKAPAA